MQRRHLAWLWSICWMLALPAYPQSNGDSPRRPGAANYIIDGWQTGDGLPHNALNAVCFGADGYLWVAGAGGIAQFDGIRFTVFRSGSLGLPDGRGLGLYVDEQKRLWAGVVGGCAWYADSQWHGITLIENGVPADVRAITESPAGTFWFGSNLGLHRWREGKLSFFKTPGFSAEAVRAIARQDDDSLLVLTWAQAYEFRNEQFLVDTNLARSIAGRELWALGRDATSNLWVCGNNLLLRSERGQWVEMTPTEPAMNGHHVAFLAARNGDIWIATRNRGIHRWRQGEWLQISTVDGLAHDDVRALCEDAQGDIWVASNGGGLNRLKPRYLEVFSRERGLGHHVTSALTQGKDGSLWIGTDGGGVWLYQGEAVKPFRAEPGFRADTFVWSLLADREGKLWMGSFTEGLFCHSATGSQQFLNTLGLDSAWLTALYETRDGCLWVGSHPGGVYCFDGKQFRKIRDVGKARHAAISAIVQSQDGAVWVGTAGEGLMRWAEEKLTLFRVADGLPSDTIAALHEDAAGILWIGTGGAGLGWWTNGRFGKINRADGLPDDAILQIQSDAAGSLWMGANLGLIRMDRSTLDDFRAGRNSRITAVLYDKSDGLPSTQFVSEHSPLSLRAQDGTLWFSLVSGLVKVEPSKVVSQTNSLDIVIEQVLAGNQPLLSKAVRNKFPETDNPSLPLLVTAKQNSLEFRYTALDLASPGKVRFKHKLEGLDEEWQQAGNQRTANYRYVPPGDYQFRLLAQSTGGRWTDQAATLSLRILPRFWQTMWFRALTLMMIAVVIGSLVRWVSLRRIRQQMARLEQERRIHQERARIAQDLHDDLGSSLTEISFLGSLPRAGTSDANDLRDRIAAMVERSARLSKALDEIVWAVNPANDTLSSTVNYLCSRLQESMRVANLRCRLDVQDVLPDVTLSAEVRHNLLLAVNEAVTNAMKHAEATQIWLRIHVRAKQLEIVVEDNGRGFVVSPSVSTGNGLGNMRRRLHEIGGGFELHSELGSKTTIRLILPLEDSK